MKDFKTKLTALILFSVVSVFVSCNKDEENENTSSSNFIITFDDYYTKVYVTLEYIQPGTTEFEVFYSPTRGFTWEGVEWFKLDPIPETTEIINEELQLYRTTFFRDAGADTAGPNDTIGQYYVFRDERKFFRYKIDLNNNNTAQTPLIRKIATEVTQ